MGMSIRILRNRKIVDINQIIQLYREGCPKHKIAEIMKISPKTASRILMENNIKKRIDALENDIINLYGKGYSERAIAKRFRISHETVSKTLRKNNIPRLKPALFLKIRNTKYSKTPFTETLERQTELKGLALTDAYVFKWRDNIRVSVTSPNICTLNVYYTTFKKYTESIILLAHKVTKPEVANHMPYGFTLIFTLHPSFSFLLEPLTLKELLPEEVLLKFIARVLETDGHLSYKIYRGLWGDYVYPRIGFSEYAQKKKKWINQLKKALTYTGLIQLDRTNRQEINSCELCGETCIQVIREIKLQHFAREYRRKVLLHANEYGANQFLAKWREIRSIEKKLRDQTVKLAKQYYQNYKCRKLPIQILEEFLETAKEKFKEFNIPSPTSNLFI